MTESIPRRNVAVLVAPAMTFLAVALMLIAAHFYDQLPVKPADCGFLEKTGTPCLACGGTRSMMALSHGRVTSALKFHPAFAIMVLLVPIWLLLGIKRFRAGDSMPSVSQQNRRLKIGVTIFIIALLLNWVYLINFLP